MYIYLVIIHVVLQLFLTEMLFSSARLRFSDQQKRAVLNWAKELHAQGVPTLRQLKLCQDRIKNLVGDPTEKVKSMLGNIFFVNSIGKAVAKVFMVYSSICIFSNNVF